MYVQLQFSLVSHYTIYMGIVMYSIWHLEKHVLDGHTLHVTPSSLTVPILRQYNTILLLLPICHLQKKSDANTYWARGKYYVGVGDFNIYQQHPLRITVIDR